MDRPIPIVVPDAANGLRMFSVLGTSAAEIETKLAQIVAGLVSTAEDFAIRGYDIGASSDGTKFCATFVAAKGVTPPDPLVEVGVDEAVFVSREGSGDNSLIPFATADAAIPPDGEQLQQKLFDLFGTGVGKDFYGFRVGGCNAGSAFCFLTLVRRPAV